MARDGQDGWRKGRLTRGVQKQSSERQARAARLYCRLR